MYARSQWWLLCGAGAYPYMAVVVNNFLSEEASGVTLKFVADTVNSRTTQGTQVHWWLLLPLGLDVSESSTSLPSPPLPGTT